MWGQGAAGGGVGDAGGREAAARGGCVRPRPRVEPTGSPRPPPPPARGSAHLEACASARARQTAVGCRAARRKLRSWCLAGSLMRRGSDEFTRARVPMQEAATQGGWGLPTAGTCTSSGSCGACVDAGGAGARGGRGTRRCDIKRNAARAPPACTPRPLYNCILSPALHTLCSTRRACRVHDSTVPGPCAPRAASPRTPRRVLLSCRAWTSRRHGHSDRLF